MDSTSPNNSDSSAYPKVDGLRVIELIGTGASSIVYKATQIVLERTVALKVMRLESLNDESLNRFKNEVRICCNLEHNGMAKVLSYGFTSDGNAPYMVMEFCEGKTLAEYRKNNEFFSEEQIKSIIVQILDVLSYAHKYKIVHRDLKPDNIILKETSPGAFEIKVVDFGVARLLESESNDGRSTRAGIGSPVYMSPEQCTGQAVDARSDLYAVGTILYELLFRRAVFDAPTALELMYRKNNEDACIDAITPGGLNLGKDMQTLLKGSLSRNPTLRPNSADEFREWFIRAMDRVQRESKVGGSNNPIFSALNSKTGLRLVLIACILLAATTIGIRLNQRVSGESKNQLASVLPNEDKASLSKVHGVSFQYDLDEGLRKLANGDFTGAIVSLKGAYQRALNPTQRVQILCKLAEANLSLSPKNADEYFAQAEQLAATSKVPDNVIADAYFQHMVRSSNLDRRYRDYLFKKCEQYWRDSTDPIEIGKYAHALHNYAEHLTANGDYAKASACFRHAYELRIRRDGGRLSLESLRSLLAAIITGNHDNDKDAETEILRVEQGILKDQNLDASTKTDLLAECGYRFYTIKSYQKAAEVLRKAEAIADVQSEGEVPDIACLSVCKYMIWVADATNNENLFKHATEKFVAINHRDLFFDEKNIYDQLKTQKSAHAMEFLEYTIEHGQSPGPENYMIGVENMEILANLYTEQKKYAEARKLFARIVKICKEAKVSNDNPYYLRAMAQLK